MLLVATAIAAPLYIPPEVHGVAEAEAAAIAQVAMAQAQAVFGAGGVEPVEARREYALACTEMRCDRIVGFAVYRIFERYYAHLLIQSPAGEIVGDFDGAAADLDELGVLLGLLARSAGAGKPLHPSVAEHDGVPGDIGHRLPPLAPPEPPQVPDKIVGFSLGLLEPMGDDALAPSFVLTWDYRSERLHWYLEYDAGILINVGGWYGCGGGGVFGDIGAGWFISPRAPTTPYLGARLGLRFEGANCSVAVGAGAQVLAGVELWRTGKNRLYAQLRGGGDFLTAYNNYGFLGLDIGLGF